MATRSAQAPVTATAAPAGRSRLLSLAAVVVAAEAVSVGACAAWLLVYRLTGHRPLDPLSAWLAVALAALAAVALYYVWRGLLHGRRQARSPAVLTQLLAAPVAISALDNGAWWAGVPLLLAAVAGLVGVLAPSSTRVFYG